MLVPVIIVGLALFLLAFVGLSKLVPTIIGLAAALGIVWGVYLMWSGFSGSNQSMLVWGVILMVFAAGVLMYLKSAFSG